MYRLKTVTPTQLIINIYYIVFDFLIFSIRVPFKEKNISPTVPREELQK